ncbi:MAG: Crp/Fnr family transcriptional regulator [Candidatus Competibacteraceae bacterium]
MTKLTADLNRMLANLPLFQQLQPEEIATLVQGTRQLHLQKGAILFHKGTQADGFYMVGYGQIKLAFPSSQGAEKVLEIVGPGQSFGEAILFLEKPYPVFAQALIDAMVLHIGKPAIFSALDSDKTLARKMLAGLSMRLHSLIHDVEAYSLRSCAQRLIGFLVQQAGVTANSEVELELPASKNVIASRLNLTPETLSRVLHTLTEAGLVTVKGRRIVIHDMERLCRFEQYS